MVREAILSFYEELVRDHGSGLYRFAYRSCGDVDLAEDLVAETFAEAWQSIRTLRDREKGKAWIYQILRHRISRWLRDRARRPETVAISLELHESQIFKTAGPPVDILDSLATRETLQETLAGMDVRFRDAFLLVFQGGFSCREAADILDVPLGTALSRIHRARNILQKAFTEPSPYIYENSAGISAGTSNSQSRMGRSRPPIPLNPRRSS